MVGSNIYNLTDNVNYNYSFDEHIFNLTGINVNFLKQNWQFQTSIKLKQFLQAFSIPQNQLLAICGNTMIIYQLHMDKV